MLQVNFEEECDKPFEHNFLRRVLLIPSSFGRFDLQASKRSRNGLPIDIKPGTSSAGVSAL